MAKKNDIKTVRLKARAYKAVGMIAPIIFLFYMVLYLKENGLTYQTYFADYENAVTVWSVGLDLFKGIMNTLDAITSVLGKVLDFIVETVDMIISFVQDTIESATTNYWETIWNNLSNWAVDLIDGLMF